jgi:hypothetical protein
VDDAQVFPLGQQQRQGIPKGFVQSLRPLTSPDDEQQMLSIPQSQLSSGTFPVGVQEIGADGHARKEGFLGREMGEGFRKTCRNEVGETGENFVGASWDGVGFKKDAFGVDEPTC